MTGREKVVRAEVWWCTLPGPERDSPFLFHPSSLPCVSPSPPTPTHTLCHHSLSLPSVRAERAERLGRISISVLFCTLLSSSDCHSAAETLSESSLCITGITQEKGQPAGEEIGIPQRTLESFVLIRIFDD